MACRVSHTTINCQDAYALSQWWKEFLGYDDVPDDPNEAGDAECMIVDRDSGHQLLFIEVDDLQEPEGRFHLDLRPTDRRRDEEVRRALALGATQVADHRNPDGTGWVVLAEHGLTFNGRHHEIYLSDPRRTAPSRLRTILRQPVTTLADGSWPRPSAPGHGWVTRPYGRVTHPCGCYGRPSGR